MGGAGDVRASASDLAAGTSEGRATLAGVGTGLGAGARGDADGFPLVNAQSTPHGLHQVGGSCGQLWVRSARGRSADATTTCRDGRQTLFHPRAWRALLLVTAVIAARTAGSEQVVLGPCGRLRARPVVRPQPIHNHL